MDNLRNVIELLFVDRDVKEVLSSLREGNTYSAVNNISETIFKNLFLSKYTRYSGNQLNSLFDIANEEWSNHNVFRLLITFANKVLQYDSTTGNVCCKGDQYLRWNEMTKIIGEDIFTTAYYANEGMNFNGYNDFLWTPYISTKLNNSNVLEEFFENNEFAELHNHFYASSMLFSLNWLAVMNFPKRFSFKEFNKLSNFEDAHRKIILAALIRAFLYSKVENMNTPQMNTIIQNFYKCSNKLEFSAKKLNKTQIFIEMLRKRKLLFVDYAIPLETPEIKNDVDCKICLVGERKLLYECFKRVGQNKQLDTLFYAYLIIKNQFRRAMIQVNNLIGFENFQYFDLKKTLFLDDKKYQNAMVNMSVHLPFCCSNINIKYIERRIKPADSIGGIYEDFNYISKYANITDANISYGYIMHFIKEPDNEKYYENNKANSIICRNEELRHKIGLQASCIKGVLTHNKDSKIIGVDAANSEFYCRPEVFSTVYRRLRSCGIGITYHVGEDFYDIVDGLRAIEEAMIFLNLQDGDRIGHGTALGLDVKTYYERIHYTAVMPKQVLLDNVAWLKYRIKEYNICCDVDLLQMLTNMYDKLFGDIFGNREGDNNIFTYINSWRLRGDEPDLYKDVYKSSFEGIKTRDVYQLCNNKDVALAREKIEACKLYFKYHYNVNVKYEGHKSTECKIEKKYIHSFVRVLSKIQEKMQLEVAEKGIHIECNPTSNLRIGNIEKYSEHPIVKFHGKELMRYKWLCCKPNISVSINTDDAGIFATSLEKEYTLMAVALSKEVNEKGGEKYDEKKIMKWLDNIRKEAIKHQFLKNN